MGTVMVGGVTSLRCLGVLLAEEKGVRAGCGAASVRSGRPPGGSPPWTSLLLVARRCGRNLPDLVAFVPKVVLGCCSAGRFGVLASSGGGETAGAFGPLASLGFGCCWGCCWSWALVLGSKGVLTLADGLGLGRGFGCWAVGPSFIWACFVA